MTKLFTQCPCTSQAFKTKPVMMLLLITLWNLTFKPHKNNQVCNRLVPPEPAVLVAPCMPQAAHRSHPITYWWGGPRALNRKSHVLWMRLVICTRYPDIVGDLGTHKSHHGVQGRVHTSSEMPLSPRTPISCPEHAFSFYPSGSHAANKSQLKSRQRLPTWFWAITVL